jgi:hypothetical protein
LPELRYLEKVKEGTMLHIVRRLPPNAQKALLAVSLIALALGLFLLLQ